MTTYRGYIIEPVFEYKGLLTGKFDFQVYKEDEPENSWIRTRVTTEQVQNEIDEKIEESTLTI
jgi:hypothetical protein